MSVYHKKDSGPISERRNIGKLIYAFIVFVSAFIVIECYIHSIDIYVPIFAALLPVILAAPTFRSDVNIRVQEITVGIGLLILAALHSLASQDIGHFEITLLPILCITALYHDTLVIGVQTGFVTLMYVLGFIFFPKLVTENLNPENMLVDFLLKMLIFGTGAGTMALLIKTNNHQVEVAKQHTQNVNCLLQLVEIKKNEAEKADRAKSAFLANMSHEIRTPLNAICGMADLMQRSELSPINAEHVSTIKLSAANLLNIINDILDFSKIEADTPTLARREYRPAAAISEVLSIISARISKKDITLTAEIDPQLPSVLVGDEARVKQILLNVMGNAAKFTKQGRISLKVYFRQTSESHIRIFFKVSDTGIGIKEEDMENLYDEFTQVNSRRNREIQGIGLGLPISVRLAKLMDGDISLSSRFGEGSEFTVEIEQQISDSSPCAHVNNDKKYHVFVYEPNGYSRESIMQILTSLNVSYTLLDTTEDIAEAAPPENTECYLTFDYISAIKAVKAAREALKACGIRPVAMIGTSDFPEDDVMNELLYIRKPLTPFSVISMFNGVSTGSRSSAAKENESKFICPTAKILIVDDNLVNLKVAEGLISSYQPQITLANSGFEALELIEKGSEFDIIFMDHMMPKMDGVETTQKIRALDSQYAKSVPIVALTANAMKGVEKAFIEAGMDDFLAKPIDLKCLADIMHRHIDHEKQEIITAPPTEDHAADGTEIRIEGVDAEAALEKFAGNAEAYLSILKLVHSDGCKKIGKIRNYLKEKDYVNYIIEVHALKSVCASIGAYSLSQSAFEHEKAGKSGDTKFIESNAEKLIQRYSKLLESIAPYVKGAEPQTSEGTEEIAAEELTERLEEILAHIDDFEGDNAIRITDGILKCRLPEDISEEEIRTLREQIDDYDYDGARVMLSALLNKV